MNKITTITFVLMLLCLLLPCSMVAQITIGKLEKPVDGALLQIKNKDDGGVPGGENSTGGIMLPRVKLSSLTVLRMGEPPALPSTEHVKHMGLMVYNMATDDDEGICPGIFIWNSQQWQKIGGRRCLALKVDKNTLIFPSNIGKANPSLPLNIRWKPIDLLPSYTSNAQTGGGLKGVSLSPAMIGGNVDATLTVDAMTAAEVTADPFLTRTSDLVITLNDGSEIKTQTINLSQTNYTVVPVDISAYYVLTGGWYEFQVKSNARWTARIANDKQGVINNLSNTSGNGNTESGERFRFYINNFTDTVQSMTYVDKVIFSSPDNLFDDLSINIVGTPLLILSEKEMTFSGREADNATERLSKNINIKWMGKATSQVPSNTIPSGSYGIQGFALTPQPDESHNGEVNSTITIDQMTKAEVTANPFMSRSSRIDFTQNDGVKSVTRSLVLKQQSLGVKIVNPVIWNSPNWIKQPHRFQPDGIMDSIRLQSNTEWKMTVIGDNQNFISYIGNKTVGTGLVATGGKNTPANTQLYDTAYMRPVALIDGNSFIAGTKIGLLFEDTQIPKRYDDIMVDTYVCGGTGDYSNPENTLVDPRDGEKYNIASFGQAGVWMTQNMRTTTYQDNADVITPVDMKFEIRKKQFMYPQLNKNMSKKDPTDYNNNKSLGLIYSWMAAMNGEYSKVLNTQGADQPRIKGICPNGWHIPSDYEWTQLSDELTRNSEKYRMAEYSSGDVLYSYCNPWNFGRDKGPGFSKPSWDGGFDVLPVYWLQYTEAYAPSIGRTPSAIWTSSPSSLSDNDVNYMWMFTGMHRFYDHRDDINTGVVRCKKDFVMEVDDPNLEIYEGLKTHIGIRSFPESIKSNVTWTSSDPSVATIDNNGIVTAISIGETQFKASVVYSGSTYTDTCAVSVKPIEVYDKKNKGYNTMKFFGQLVLDVMQENNNAESGLHSLRQYNKTDFSNRTPHDPSVDNPSPSSGVQVYTLAFNSGCRNIRIMWKANDDLIDKIEGNLMRIAGGWGNNADRKITIHFKNDLNTRARGLTFDNSLKAKIYTVATNNNTESKQDLIFSIQDASAYGAVRRDNNKWIEFMPHNLGAVQTVNPLSPAKGLHGDWYQWGKKAPVAWGPNAPSPTPSGAISGWDASWITPNNAWNAAWIDGQNGDSQNGIPIKSTNDPCPSGWRIPSYKEMQQTLNYYEIINTPRDTWDQNAPDIYARGIWLNGRSLFIPGVSKRMSDNGRYDDDPYYKNYGWFWTSAACTYYNNNNDYRGWDVEMGAGSSRPSSSGAAQSFGMSIRCIRDKNTEGN